MIKITFLIIFNVAVGFGSWSSTADYCSLSSSASLLLQQDAQLTCSYAMSTLPQNVPPDTSPSQRAHSLKAPSTSPCSTLPATMRFSAMSTTLHDGTLFATTPPWCPTPSSLSPNYSKPDVFKSRFFLSLKTFAIIHLNIQGLIGQTTRKALGVCDTHN